MKTNLNLIGMEKGRQYETIITTKNSKNIKNAAPIGVICAGENKILNRIFKGSHTLENIISQKEFIVNITHDPNLFTVSLLGNLPEEYFNELVINRPTHAMNRGFAYVIESLANLTRFDMVNDDKKEEYIKRFREANRVVVKVGYKEDIKAMHEIKKELIKKGYKP